MPVTISKGGSKKPGPKPTPKKYKRPPAVADVAPPPAPEKAPVYEHRPAFQRIIDMGSERQTLLDTMLLRGDQITEIVKVVQGEWKLFVDAKPNTLLQMFKRYRDQNLYPRAAQQSKRMEQGLAKAGERTKVSAAAIFRRLDVQSDLEWLAGVQRKRLEKVLEVENTMKLPFDAVTKLIGPYQTTLAKIADLQLETGLIRRAPKVVHGTMDLISQGKEVPEFAVKMDERARERQGVALLLQALQEGADDVIEGDFTHVGPATAPDPNP